MRRQDRPDRIPQQLRLGMSIRDVFEARGEAAFRRAEADEVEMTTDRRGLVVATGGGAFASERNRKLIHGSGGVSVFLDPPWEIIVRRLEGEATGRPKWIDQRHARSLYDSRLPDYLRASIRLEIDGGEDPQRVTERIVEALSEIACVS